MMLIRIDASYVFIRITDDSVDNATSPEGAELAYRSSITSLREAYSNHYIGGDAYSKTEKFENIWRLSIYKIQKFVPQEFLLEMFKGFESDLQFRTHNGLGDHSLLPIQTEEDLLLYARRVAGGPFKTFIYGMYDAEGMLDSSVTPMKIIMSSKTRESSIYLKDWMLEQMVDLAIAVQLTDIAKDLLDDSRKGQIYLPLAWFQTEEEMAFLDALIHGKVDPSMLGIVSSYTSRLFDMAEKYYRRGIPSFEYLPEEYRMPSKIIMKAFMVSTKDTWKETGGKVERVPRTLLCRTLAALSAIGNF